MPPASLTCFSIRPIAFCCSRPRKEALPVIGRMTCSRTGSAACAIAAASEKSRTSSSNRIALLPERAPGAALLLAGLVMAALHRELRLLLLLLGPIAERIAPPGLLQAERRQLQIAPDLDGALHIGPLGQRQRWIGPGHGGVDQDGGGARRLARIDQAARRAGGRDR